VPIAAVVLSLLALIAPELTLAPLLAGEPLVRAPRPIDHEALTLVPHRPIDVPAAGQGTAPPLTIPGGAAEQGPAYQAALDAARASARAWGATFAVVRDGTLVWAGSSGRARDGRTALTADSPLVLGSVTKTYVAAVVLKLAQEGRIDLDEPASRYLPGVAALGREVTVRELLNHTSGIADVFNDETRTGIEQHPEHPWTARELLGTLHGPWYLPGEGWAYSNANYYLLGMLVERVTRDSLADEMAARVFGPVGLHATRMLSPSDPASPLSPAWTTIFWASGAMSASAPDLARWGDALYGGTVLTDAARRQMLTFNDHDYGLGVQRLDLGRVKGYGHTGLLNTYTTLLLYLPDQDVTLALLVNRADVNLGGLLFAEPRGGGPSLVELAAGIDGAAEPAE
jgi:D-alanyl-D-alanine carboxypeptidase